MFCRSCAPRSRAKSCNTAVARRAGTMPLAGEKIAITSSLTTVPRANAGHRRRTSPPSIHSYGTPTSSRLRRYGCGSIAAPGGNRSRPPVTVTSGVPASCFDRRPRVVGARRQPHVAGRVVRPPDDPRMVVRRPAHVAELELLEADHRRRQPRQPVGRRRAEAAEPDDGVLELIHCVPRPRRPRLAARSLALTRSHDCSAADRMRRPSAGGTSG